MKKLLSLALALIMLFSATTALAASEAPAAAPITEPVTLKLWHSATSSMLTALEKLVADFNALDNNITIEMEFQGIYEEAVAKLRGLEPGTGPDIMQLWEAGTAWMANSDYIIKMQSFINRDGFDVSDFQPNITGYYSINGELYSMPFNCSVPCLIYNKTVAKEIGLDLDKAFYSVDDLVETAKAYKNHGMPYGGTLPNASWYFEEFMSRQGAPMVDEGNGHTGTATRTVMQDSGEAVEALNAWKRLYDTGASFNFGQGGTEDPNQFLAGNLGFTLYSSAGIPFFLQSLEGVFELGVAPYPRVHADDVGGGVAVGGASMWIMDNKDDVKANAAWEFIKFLVQPENQAYFTTVTGYLPVSIAAKEVPSYVAYVNNVNPVMKTLLSSLEDSDASSIAALFGVYSQTRIIVQNGIEEMITTGISAEEALANICQQVDDEIYMYNRTNK